ncbi:MAG: cation:proton antiporter [Sandaracinaceae bacterium]|nr:cation:proton antiporter [Sandaracinaceae bacterium]
MSSPLDTPAGLLLVQLAVILGLSRLLGVFARRLRQPLVVAEIAAGVLLGPSVLGALAPTAAEALFPTGALATLHSISQLALVLFMFLVGLRLDTGQLARTARTSLFVSQAGMIVPFALGACLAWWLYGELSTPEVPFVLFALFVGLTMSITALPVLAKLLGDRHLLDTRLGAVAVASAAVDDVAAWCLLAIVVSFARAGELGTAVGTSALALALGVAAFVALRPALARLGRRISTGGGMTEGMMAGVLVLVLCAGLLTESLGIHALFGSFVLGTVFPREGGLARALADRLEDLTMVLLLPVFFAYSGLRTDVALLHDGRAWLMCGAVLVIGSIGKIGGGALAARLAGLPPRQAATVGVLLNMRGAMHLVVINMGLDLGVLSPTLFAILVIVGLTTTALTDPLLRWASPSDITLRARASPATERTAAPPAILCVPGPTGAPAMALLAHALGGSDDDGALYGLKLDRDRRTAAEEVEDELEQLIDHAAALGHSVRPLSFVSTDPGADICRTADVKGAELVLVGATHVPEQGQLIDPVLLDVLRSPIETVGVLVARQLAEIDRVLVLHTAPEEDDLLALAKRIAERTGAALRLVDAASELALAGPADLVVSAVDTEGRTRLTTTLPPKASALLARMTGSPRESRGSLQPSGDATPCTSAPR